jgi:hypothetical protein
MEPPAAMSADDQQIMLTLETQFAECGLELLASRIVLLRNALELVSVCLRGTKEGQEFLTQDQLIAFIQGALEDDMASDGVGK